MLKILQQRRNIPGIVENKGTFRKPEHVIAHSHEDGLVLLDTSKGLVFTANRTAATIWEGLSLGRTLEAIAAQLSAESGVPCDRILEDARVYVGELQQRRLISADATS